MAETSSAVLSVAIFAAIAPENAQSTRIAGGQQPLSGAEGVGPHEFVPSGAEQQAFATLLGQLRSLSVERPTASHTPSVLIGSSTLGATDSVGDNSTDAVSLPLPTPLTEWFDPGEALLPLPQTPAGGGPLPEGGPPLPEGGPPLPEGGPPLPQGGTTLPLAEDGSHTLDVTKEVDRTDRALPPVIRPSGDLTTVPDEHRRDPVSLPPAQKVPEAPARVRSLSSPATGVLVASSAEVPRPVVEGLTIDAGSLDRMLDRMEAGEMLPTSKAGDQTEVLLTKATSMGFARTDSFQPSPAPYVLRETVNDVAVPQRVDLDLPADKTQWTRPLAQRLSLLIQQGTTSADLRLNPPHLGRVEVRISIQNDQASIWLSAPNVDVREILEQTLPRLGELLENSGLELADSEVTEEGFERFMARDEETRDGANAVAEKDEARESRYEVRLGLLDTYA